MNIVVTGASRGIGKAIAEKFAENGHDLFLVARKPATLEKAVEELKKKYPKVGITYKGFDLSLKSQVEECGRWLSTSSKQIDVLVNNAGSFLPGNIQTEAEGTLEKMMELNLYSAYYLTRALLPGMIRRKDGHIFNMCSIASLIAYPNGGAYSISKFALLGFTKNLREELREFNIKVTAVLPGAVYTDSWASSGVRPDRIMESGDIADLVYAASQLSPQTCLEEIVIRPQLGDL